MFNDIKFAYDLTLYKDVYVFSDIAADIFFATFSRG